MERALRLLHPFMPFVTEALWQALPQAVKSGSEALIIAPWPMLDEAYLDDAAEAQMGLLMDLIRGIRAVRAEYNVQAGKRIAATIVTGAALDHKRSGGLPTAPLRARRSVLVFLARLDEEALQIVPTSEPLSQAASVVVGDVVAYLPLAGMVDIAAEVARLQKSLENLEGRIAGSQARLAGEFAEKAPTHIVERERERLTEMRTEAAQVREQIARLQGG
jgi:valyl-tRNA synthetase